MRKDSLNVNPAKLGEEKEPLSDAIEIEFETVTESTKSAPEIELDDNVFDAPKEKQE